MESTEASNSQQNLRTSPNQLQSLRDRIAEAFSGTSVIGSLQKNATPRIGLQLIGRHADPDTQSDPPMSQAQRTHSSNGSLADPGTSSDGAIAPLPAAHVTAGSSISPDRGSQTRRSARRKARNGGSRRQHSQVAWARPVHKSSKTPGAHWYSLGPGLKSKAARRKMNDCAISATLLSMVLAVYLALTFSSTVTAREFHVIMILILTFLTIYLSHSFIRLFMIASCRFGGAHHHRRIRRKGDSSGYAHPEQPIPVTFARDEEILVGGDKPLQPIVAPPPAYGLWRSSVRMNPNMVYWQRVHGDRNQTHKTGQNGGDTDSNTNTTHQELRQAPGNRPPSYISDDGVRYVVDIQPRPQVGSWLRDPSDEFIHPAERTQMKT